MYFHYCLKESILVIKSVSTFKIAVILYLNINSLYQFYQSYQGILITRFYDVKLINQSQHTLITLLSVALEYRSSCWPRICFKPYWFERVIFLRICNEGKTHSYIASTLILNYYNGHMLCMLWYHWLFQWSWWLWCVVMCNCVGCVCVYGRCHVNASFLTSYLFLTRLYL